VHSTRTVHTAYFKITCQKNDERNKANAFLIEYLSTHFICSITHFIFSSGRILKANLSWSPTWAKFCQLIAILSVVLP